MGGQDPDRGALPHRGSHLRPARLRLQARGTGQAEAGVDSGARADLSEDVHVAERRHPGTEERHPGGRGEVTSPLQMPERKAIYMRVEAKLKELGLELPPTPRPAANYVGAVQTGNLLFISGHGPTKDGKMAYVGKVGKDLSVEQGYEAARLVALNCLASAKSVLGDLD